MPDLTLYVDATFASPYAMACYVTLLEKKLPFALKTVNLAAGEHTTPEYRAMALTGRVPMLVHGDMVLNESSAIIEYLDDVFPDTPVLPLGPAQRARARQVQAWIRSDLLALRTERSTAVIFDQPSSAPLSDAGQAAADKVIDVASRLISGEHLFGAWSIADTDLALMLQRLIKNSDPVPDNVKAYANAQWQRPSVQAWVAAGLAKGAEHG